MDAERNQFVRKRRVFATCGAALLAISSISAQRPLITVGGSMSNYSDLPAAVTAAAPGSVLVVRPGLYTGFATSKPLRVVLDFDAASGLVSAPTGASYAIDVTGLPAGTDFVVVGRGARVGAGSVGAIRVANCAGRVILDGISASLSAIETGLEVSHAAAVLVQNSDLSGRYGLQLQDAALTSGATTWTGLGGFGVFAVRGALEFSLGRVSGSLAPAVRVFDSSVRLAGDGSTPLDVLGQPAGPVAAFEAINSEVRWDVSQFNLVPQNGAPGFLPIGGQVIVAKHPALRASSGPPGGAASATLTRSTPAPGLIAVGYLAQPHPVAGVSRVWLDESAAAVAVAVGVVDGAGLTAQVVWPNVTWLLGEVLGCQGFVLAPTGILLGSAPGVWAAM